MNSPTMHYSVYPGEFVPVTNEDEIKRCLGSPGDSGTMLPCLNLTELNNSYAVDVAAPGLERNMFVVYGDNHSLFVCSVQDDKIIPDHKHFERHITLPSDADAELTVAEYKNSVLHFYIPKTKEQSKHSVTRIVVY